MNHVGFNLFTLFLSNRKKQFKMLDVLEFTEPFQLNVEQQKSRPFAATNAGVHSDRVEAL